MSLYHRTQNLKREDKTRGWFNRRGWLINRSDGESVMDWQLVFGPSNSAGLTWGEGYYGGLSLFVGAWFVRLFLGFRGRAPRFWRGKTGVTLDGDRLAISWRVSGMEWPPKYGWERSACLLDVLLGERRHREGSGEVSRIVVKMPEGEYYGTCTMRNDSWKRPLWFRHTIRRAHIDMDAGVPIPGKGESAWDCGDDALWGMTCPADNAKQAANAIRESALQTRQRYGGRDWRPVETPE